MKVKNYYSTKLLATSLLLAIINVGAWGQSPSIPAQNRNYQVTNRILVPGKTVETQLSTLTIQETTQSVEYLTGSGKTEQTVVTKGSPLQKDVVSFKVYDSYGREATKYLPYASAESNAAFKSSLPSIDYYNFYNNASTKIARDASPFSKSIFSPDPLSRISQQGSVGASWQPNTGASKSVTYGTNATNEIKRWSILDLGNFKFGLYYTFYDASELSVITTIDEQGLVTKQYKDYEGKIISARTQVSASVWAETNYVYDDKGDLRFILPPEAINSAQLQFSNSGPLPDNYVLLTENTVLYPSSFIAATDTTPAVNTFVYLEGVRVTMTASSTPYSPIGVVRPYPQTVTNNIVNQYAYQYLYDNLHRKIAEKTPGTDWKYFVYDNRDQLVLSQDGNQRLTNQYYFTKYDDLGRPVLSGLTTIAGTINQVRSTVDSQTILNEQIGNSVLGYTNNAYPIVSDPNSYLLASYYDNYSTCTPCQDANLQFVASESWQTTSNEPYQKFDRVLGKIVGSSIKILGTNNWLNTVSYYNRQGQTIQTIGTNHLGGRDRVSTLVDFSGKKLEELHTAISYNSGGIATMRKRFDYDHAGRLLKTYHKINGQNEVVLSAFEYNELGQVVRKKLHSENNGATYLQALDYRYNIRGWMTNFNTTAPESGDEPDYFGMDLSYNDAIPNAGNATRVDGLVSAIKWKNDLSGKQRLYNFSYDNLKQLSGASHKMSSVAGNWGSEADFFNEAGISYDLNGNIKSLNRNTEYFNGAGYVAEPIDQLTYDYGSGGNQLQFVRDNISSTNKDKGFKDGGSNAGSDPDYAYDANGNVTKDQNKGITNITYYFNNLPRRVTFADGSYLENTYDAAGIKLTQVYSKAGTTATTDYVGATVLLNGQVLVVNHEEGRITAPTYSNLMDNKDAGSTAGYAAYGSVGITAEYLNAQTYVKVVANQTSYPGVFPISTTKGASFPVKAGETYSFKVLGYQSVGSNAYLYATDQNNNNLLWTGAQLPVGAANENWVTSSITIPAGVTQIKLGVLWNGATIGNTFFINKVALYKTNFEYNYFLEDQVGSPRVVLQTSPATITYMATMETENLADEGAKFQNINTNYIVMSPGNTTPGGNEVIKLNAQNKIGPAKSIRVYPGDKINASAMSYYVNQGGFSKTPAATMASILAPVFGGVAGAPGDPGSIFSNVGQAYSTGSTLGLSPDQGTAYPSAFLNFVLFDKNYKPLNGKSVPISTTANAPQPLALPEITALEVGYVFIYLSYDNDTGGDVFFDDLKITVQESPVIQVNNYYPFGMQSYTWLREGETDNAYLYQGKELIAQTGWHDFGSRMYWSDLGRWFATDPKGDSIPSWSIYNAMKNDPISNIDPDGEFVLSLITKIMAGDINNVGDVFRTVLTGSITDPINLLSALNPINTIGTTVGLVSGLGNGIFNGDWDRLGNTGKLFLGHFYTDNKRGVLDEIWQGVSRNTVESLQTTVGYNYSQLRNATGDKARVDYFGGATFVTKENQSRGTSNGVSLGNFLNINIDYQINGGFKENVLRDPLFMHEYGHTFDSRLFGPLYLPVIGLPSALGADWTEIRANRHAEKYFRENYGVNWAPFTRRFPLN